MLQIVKPAKSDRTSHYVGRAPSSIALANARASLMNAAHYRRHGTLCIAEKSNITSSVLHHFVFYPAMTHPSGATTCNIWITAEFSDACSSDIVMSIDGSDVSTVAVSAAGTGDDASNKLPKGPRFSYLHAATIDDASAYNSIRVSFASSASIQCLSFQAIMVPEYEIADEDARYIAQGQFDPGAILKGYDTATGITNGSIDALCQYMIDNRDPNTASWISLSRRCLFGWAAGRGRYAIHASSGTPAAMPLMVDSFRPRLHPRNLTEQSTILVDVCIAYRGDTGAGIRFTARGTSDTLTISPSAHTSATPTTTSATGLLEIDADGDEVEIDLMVSTSAAFEIFAIAIFEPAASLAL